jgi:hypothetical protein
MSITDAPPAPGLKECTRCHQVKLLTEYYAGRKRKGDQTPEAERPRMSWCKTCHRSYTTKRRRDRIALEGEDYLKGEADRVHKYISDPEIADERSAAARAMRAADRQLRALHHSEYTQLLARARREEGLAA